MRTAFLALLLSATLIGCMQKAPPKVEPVQTEKPPVVADYEHKVGSGETLAAIANWYTGSPKNVAAIKEANPGLNAKRLHRGQMILIPGNLLVRREPLPHTQVSRNIPKSVTKRAPDSVRQDDNAASLGDSGSRDSGDADIVEKSISAGEMKNPVPDVAMKKDEVPMPPPETARKTTEDDLLNDTPKNPPPPKMPVEEANPPAEPVAKPIAKTPPAGGTEKKPGAGSDAEREKLLDELLSQ